MRVLALFWAYVCVMIGAGASSPILPGRYGVATVYRIISGDSYI